MPRDMFKYLINSFFGVNMYTCEMSQFDNCRAQTTHGQQRCHKIWPKDSMPTTAVSKPEELRQMSLCLTCQGPFFPMKKAQKCHEIDFKIREEKINKNRKEKIK